MYECTKRGIEGETDSSKKVGFKCQTGRAKIFFQVSDFNLSPLFCLLFQNDAKNNNLEEIE